MKYLKYIAAIIIFVLAFSSTKKRGTTAIIPLDRELHIFPVTAEGNSMRWLDGVFNKSWLYNDNLGIDDYAEGANEKHNNLTVIWLGANYTSVYIEVAVSAGGWINPTYTFYNEARTLSVTVTGSGGYQSFAAIQQATSQAAAFPVAWVDIFIPDFNLISEIRVQGTFHSAATDLYTYGVSDAPDPGVDFYGGGVLYTGDTLVYDCYQSTRVTSTGAWWNSRQDSSYFRQPLDNRYTPTGTPYLMQALKRGGHPVQLYSVGASALRNPTYPSYNPALDVPNFNQMLPAQFVKDIPVGADSTLLGSWQAQYRLWAQIAALYGNNPAADISDFTFFNQPAPGTRGQDVVKIYEVGGQEDVANFKQLQGHHQMKPWFQKIQAGSNGVKFSDPNAVVIAAATTKADSLRMRSRFILSHLQNGKNNPPTKGHAFNQYMNAKRQQTSDADSSLSPEEFGIYDLMVTMKRQQRRYEPGGILAYTEVGFDTTNSSPYKVRHIPGIYRRQTAADHLIRTQAWVAAAKVDRLYHYYHSSDGSPYFAGMAAVGFKFDGDDVFIGYDLLHTYYWLTTNLSVLRNYNAWPQIIRNGGSTSHTIMKYTHRTNPDSVVYMYWNGTYNNSTTNFTLSIPNLIGTTGELIQMAFGNKTGSRSTETFIANNLNLVARETPAYIRVKETSGAVQGRVEKQYFTPHSKRYRQLSP